MKLTRTKVLSVLLYVAQVAALIALSQAASFGRWNQWKPLSDQINFHATLLAAVAAGLFFAVLVIQSLITRIENLERVVASSPQSGVPIDSV